MNEKHAFITSYHNRPMVLCHIYDPITGQKRLILERQNILQCSTVISLHNLATRLWTLVDFGLETLGVENMKQ